MKKVLLLGAGPDIVGDLQANYARHCEILSTDNTETAYLLLKTGAIELLLIQLPENNHPNYENLKKFLKKIKRRKFKSLTRILIASKGGDNPVSYTHLTLPTKRIV